MAELEELEASLLGALACQLGAAIGPPNAPAVATQPTATQSPPAPQPSLAEAVPATAAVSPVPLNHAMTPAVT